MVGPNLTVLFSTLFVLFRTGTNFSCTNLYDLPKYVLVHNLPYFSTLNVYKFVLAIFYFCITGEVDES